MRIGCNANFVAMMLSRGGQIAKVIEIVKKRNENYTHTHIHIVQAHREHGYRG